MEALVSQGVGLDTSSTSLLLIRLVPVIRERALVQGERTQNPPVHGRNDQEFVTLFNAPPTGFRVVIFLAPPQHQE